MSVAVREGYQQIWLRNIPGELSAAIRADAIHRNATLADTVLGTLADHYEVPAILSGRTYTPQPGGSRYLEFAAPEALHDAIRRHARRDKLTGNSIVLRILAERYAVAYQPVRRGRR